MRRTVPLRPHVRDALIVWGQLIRQGRLERGWSVAELAARANVSDRTVAAAEAGSQGTAVGTMVDLADLVGVPLFGIEDRAELAQRRRRGEDLIALLPQRVRRTRDRASSDDF